VAHTYPAWVAALDDRVLARAFGAQTLDRGLAYAQQGRVGSIQSVGNLMTASVAGSGYRGSYRTTVALPESRAAGWNEFDGDELAQTLVVTCTCPMRQDCKHGIALIAHARAVVVRRATPAWQRSLAPLLRASVPAVATRGVPVGVQVSLTHRDVELRPVYEGPRGWVRGQFTWDAVKRRSGNYKPNQLEALDAIRASVERQARARWGYYSIVRASHLLLSEAGADVWDALAAARAAGVAFVPGKNSQAIEWPDERATVALSVEPGENDALVIRSVVSVGGDELTGASASLIGSPPHGLLVARSPGAPVQAIGFADPLDEARASLVGMAPLTVPAADIAEFAFNFLPALRRNLPVVQDDHVALPEVGTPRLLLRLTPHTPTAAAFEVGLRYGDGEHTVNVTVRDGELSPVRDGQTERALLGRLPAGPPGLPPITHASLPSHDVLTGRALFDLAAWLPTVAEHPDVVVEIDGELPDYREAGSAPQVELVVDDRRPGTDWFDLQINVTVAGEQVPLPTLLEALTLDHDHVLLTSGLWFSLDHPELERLRVLVHEARALVDPDSDGSRLRLRPEHAGWWDELVSLGVVAEQAAGWREVTGRLLTLGEAPPVAIPATVQAELRPYQTAGVQWMETLRSVGLGGILADDMGLGKTLQALTLVASLHERGLLSEPVLVVAPSTVVGAWAEQAARFVPSLDVRVLTTTGRKRAQPLADEVAGAHLVVTSYAVMRLDADEFIAKPWAMALFDEAQFIKNPAARTYLVARRLRAPVRFALTGTPLENNLMDLWSMLSLAAPGLFPDPKDFTERFRRPIEQDGDVDALARLLRRTRPLLLRRTKELVAPELPPRQEQIVRVELVPAHRRIYDRQLQRERQKVLGLVGDMNRNRITILRSLTLLRQLSLAPGLVDEAHADIASVKITALMEMLDEVVAGGHRALVFSQFTSFLRLVRERLAAEHIGTVYLDGRTRDRPARVQQFRTGSDPVFLISLKAGGFGLTLTEADYVFVLDPWWNPAAEAQAVDRTHRIGQSKTVMVYRLVAENTIEDKVVALQQRKRALFDQVVGSGTATDDAVTGALSADDIRGLLDL